MPSPSSFKAAVASSGTLAAGPAATGGAALPEDPLLVVVGAVEHSLEALVDLKRFCCNLVVVVVVAVVVVVFVATVHNTN